MGLSVHSFEASAETASLLRRNVRENALSNVIVIERAVASRSGETVECYTVPGQLGTAHLTVTDLGRDGSMQRVQTIALDDYPVSRVDFIKLDVEGSEIAAIEGARKVIEQHRPILAVEYNPAPAAWFGNRPRRALVLTSLYGEIAMIED